MPLDSYVDHPLALMAVVPGDPYMPELWEEYRDIEQKHGLAGLRDETIGKPAFYARGQRCHVYIVTSEKARYANIIVKKDIVNVKSNGVALAPFPH